MIFRNVTLFHLPVGTPVPTHEALAECALKPVGPLELSSRGFVPPIGRDHDQLLVEIPGALWVTVGGEDRILPGAVVNDLLSKKLAAIEQQEGRRPGGRTRKRIKDDLIHELLPRTLVKPSRVNAIFIPGGGQFNKPGLLAIDTASRKVAESVASEIRRAVGSFPALPLNAGITPSVVMTEWLDEQIRLTAWSVGESCELRDPADRGSVVRIRGQNLLGDEVQNHLNSGKRAVRVEMQVCDDYRFVIGEDLVLRGITVLDGAMEGLESTDRDSVEAEMMARFVMMRTAIDVIVGGIECAFRVTPP